MDINKFLQKKDRQKKEKNYLSFSAEELSAFRADEVQYIIDYFHGHTLMQLPQVEIDFFDWLKKSDAAVWDDLWGDQIDTYLVSIDFLRQLADPQTTFPICDLVEEPNYWFSARHIKPQGMQRLEEILLKIENDEALAADELFLFELTQRATDIWHFCYRHHFNVNRMKQLIEQLVYEGLLVHLPNREDLVKYIDF